MEGVGARGVNAEITPTPPRGDRMMGCWALAPRMLGLAKCVLI